MNTCSLCKSKTNSQPYDTSKPVICENCKRKCKVCGKPVAVIGHSRLCSNCKET